MRSNLSLIASSAALWLALAGPVAAQAQTPAPPPAGEAGRQPPAPGRDGTAALDEQFQWLLRWLQREHQEEDLARFAEPFLVEVPAPRLAAVHASVRDTFALEGGAEVVSERREAGAPALVAVVRSRDGGRHLRVHLRLDEAGRIIGLLLQPAAELDADRAETYEELGARLAAMRGEVEVGAWRFGDGGRTAVFTHGEGRPLAVGSAFKLWVLGELCRSIAEGERRWQDPLVLQGANLSLPSGVMHTFQSGSSFPLREYATKMIAISDNTATDHLMALLGREAVEDWMAGVTAQPRRNQPMLNTMELFRLKLSGDAQALADFAAADEPQRRRMLADRVRQLKPNRALAAVWRVPVEVRRVEWFATTADLCAAFEALDEFAGDGSMAPLQEVLGSNPGLPLDRQRWVRIWFKGGSEPGVLSLNWLLERDDGERFCLSLIWNDAERPVDEAELIARAFDAINLLARHEP